MGRRNRFTTHHIIPSSRERDGFAPHQQANKIHLLEYVHSGLHLQHGNSTPQEQLENWLRINIQVLSEEVRGRIFGLINLPQDMFYQKQFIKKTT